FAHVDPVVLDAAGGGVGQAGDDVHEGGFARAGGADDRDGRAGGDRERDVVQEGDVGPGDLVLDGEGDPLDGEVDPARARQGAAPVAQVAAGVGDPADPVVAHERARQVPEHEPDRAHGEGHHGEQVGGGDDVADVDEVRPGPHGADGEHREGRKGGKQVDDRVENGTDLAHPHVRGAQLVGFGGETPGLERF